MTVSEPGAATTQAPVASSEPPRGDVGIRIHDVSKFYGEVLGVNQVNLEIGAGITSLVGPNGSGKTTLMNLVAGLIRPSEGSVTVLGRTPSDPENLFRDVGYCTQFDSFPRGATGRSFVRDTLRVHGYSRRDADDLAMASIERVGLTQAAGRKADGYSKGMRQRLRLAQSLAHEPKVLILDEPLNGLDPMARAEVIAVFRDQAAAGLHLLISSHILHEVDMLSDRVIFISNGYIVAEGEIEGVRSEVKEQPLQIYVRCDRPAEMGAEILRRTSLTEIQMHDDGGGFHLRTRRADRLFALINDLVVEEDYRLEAIGPADENVQAVYQYLVGDEGVS